VLTWGEGKFGRLGHGGERNSIRPKVIEALMGRRVKRVACGGFHAVCVSEEGEVFSWGGGEHGQLVYFLIDLLFCNCDYFSFI